MLGISGAGKGVMEQSEGGEQSDRSWRNKNHPSMQWPLLLIPIRFIKLFDVILDRCFLEGITLVGVFLNVHV